MRGGRLLALVRVIRRYRSWTGSGLLCGIGLLIGGIRLLGRVALGLRYGLRRRRVVTIWILLRRRRSRCRFLLRSCILAF